MVFDDKVVVNNYFIVFGYYRGGVRMFKWKWFFVFMFVFYDEWYFKWFLGYYVVLFVWKFVFNFLLFFVFEIERVDGV